MLRQLLAKALSYRLLVLAAALIVAGIGGWTFANLPIDAYPDIAPTQVKIILKAPGMTPDEVETRILAPIEQEMLGLPRQAVLRATAKYAIADITIDFVDGTDIYWARQQVSERLAGVMGDLPAGVGGGLAPISTPLSELFMFTIDGPQSLEERRTALDWTIRPALRTVPGVADVNALGGYVRTFEVRPDPAALGAAGLTLDDVKAAVESGNRNDGAGRLANGENALIVRAVGAIQTLDDLRAVVLHASGGRVLRLGDVATVATGSLTRYGAVSSDGRGETVEGLVIALREASTGTSVSARSSAAASANMMVSATGANNLPSSPSSETSGRNTSAMMSRPAETGTITSLVARKTWFSRGVESLSFTWASRSTTFSTTTTAPSTSMPMAMASPPRLIRLAVSPQARIRIKQMSAAIGSVVATIAAARQSPRNSISSTTTSKVASSSASSTVPTARPIRSERS